MLKANWQGWTRLENVESGKETLRSEDRGNKQILLVVMGEVGTTWSYWAFISTPMVGRSGLRSVELQRGESSNHQRLETQVVLISLSWMERRDQRKRG